MLDRIATLEQRLQTMEDIAAIKDMKSWYWQCVDRQQPEFLRDCLTDDAFIEMDGVPCHEREPFIEFIRRAGCRPGVFNLHAGQNPRIAITGPGKAEGTWDMLFTGVDMESRLVIRMTGVYRDTYVRRDSRWFIASLKFQQTSFLMQRIDEKGSVQTISMGQNNKTAFGD